jgi:hypothetical protein
LDYEEPRSFYRIEKFEAAAEILAVKVGYYAHIFGISIGKSSKIQLFENFGTIFSAPGIPKVKRFLGRYLEYLGK